MKKTLIKLRMKRLLIKLWFIMLMSRIEWHNRKYDDYYSCEISFTLTGVYLIAKFDTAGDGIIKSMTNYRIATCYSGNKFVLEKSKHLATEVYSVFSNKKLLIKELKRRNII